MGQTSIAGIKVVGLAAAVPEKKIDLTPFELAFGKEEVKKISESTGISERRSDPSICTSDLCFSAAEQLLETLKWDRSEVDLLVFVSQTSDYWLPSTASCLHGRLRLAKKCGAFDINLGCSGYPYGLWTVASMMRAGGVEKVLLLVGETASRDVSPLDRGTTLIFGDAGTATALQYREGEPPIHFTWGSDGTGWDAIIRPSGGQRLPYSSERAIRKPVGQGNFRAETDTAMNGAEIFSFTIREVPPMLQQALQLAGWNISDVDQFIFHQANRFLLQHLSKKCKIPFEKVPLSIEHFGNTSSASIPLTIVHQLHQLQGTSMKAVLLGFGVGLSWSSASMVIGPLKLPPIIEVRSPTND